MKHITVFIFLFLEVSFSSASKAQICPDKKTVCQNYENCVTWERGCSVGANCLESGVYEVHSDCIQLSEFEPPLLPSIRLCNWDEVFARSLDKMCPKHPCPIRIGYNCYPDTGPTPTCRGINCPAGMYCCIGESCSDVLCEPKALCKANL